MNAKRRGTDAVGHHLKWLSAPFVIAILLSLLVPAASAGWNYRKQIEIDHTKVAGDLTNFPVLISITDSDLAAHAQPDGGDIVFTNEANSTRYDHEIEYFNKTSGELVAWVKIDSLSSSTNTTIWMWYGNSNCPNQENATGVWDSNYKLVQHLAETTGTHYDSTANDNDGTPHGGNLTQNAPGKINGADEFHTNQNDTYGDYIHCGNDSSLNITGDITIEAWVKNIAKWKQSVVGRYNVTSPWPGYGFAISIPGDAGKACYWSSKHGSWVAETVSERLDQDGKWHHIAIAVSGTTGNFYRDGERVE